MNDIFLKISPILFLFFSVYLYYLTTSSNISTSAKFLQMRRYAIASMVALLPLYITDTQLQPLLFSSHILVAVLVITTERTIYYLSTKQSITSFNMPFPIALGLYTFCAMISLHILLLNISTCYKSITLFITLMQLLILFPSIIYIIYYILFRSEINTNTIMLLYQTDKKETLEYLKSISNNIWIISIIFFTSLFIILYKSNIYLSFYIPILTANQISFFAILSISIFFYSTKKLFMRCSLMEAFKEVNHHYKHLQSFKIKHSHTLNTLQVTKKNIPQNVILIIGESASRDYMSAFAPIEDNTTPWLKNHLDDPCFYFFKNAYSCASSTVPALSRALTTANYYNTISFDDSLSVIDIAKKAGYKTLWFSNQAKMGVHDTPITMIAETADIAKWVSDSYTNEKNFDELLLNFLPEIDSSSNNFIVFHLMGSHIDYNNRYPKNFQIWSDNKEVGRVADFKNSLLYTDYILEKIYNYFYKENNLDALIYFSDHGTNPNRKRHPDGSGFSGLRIPLVLYLSDKYKKTNTVLSNALFENQKKYFTNDLLFDLICSVLNVETNYSLKTQSIGSPSYSFNKTTLKTDEGKFSLMNDPFDV